MQFLAFLKPTRIRFLIVVAFAAYFLAISTTGFNQGDHETGTATPDNDLTVHGYPYGYLTDSPKGGTHFHFRALVKNLAYYYVLACLLAALIAYTANTYRFGEHKQKVILTGAFLLTTGLWLAPYVQSPWQLYVTLGLLVGGGLLLLAMMS